MYFGCSLNQYSNYRLGSFWKLRSVWDNFRPFFFWHILGDMSAIIGRMFFVYESRAEHLKVYPYKRSLSCNPTKDVQQCQLPRSRCPLDNPRRELQRPENLCRNKAIFARVVWYHLVGATHYPSRSTCDHNTSNWQSLALIVFKKVRSKHTFRPKSLDVEKWKNWKMNVSSKFSVIVVIQCSVYKIG